MAAPRLSAAGPEQAAVPRRDFLGRVLAALGGGALFARPRAARAEILGTTPFLAEIQMFAGNFPPKGWAFCNGQLLAISTNTALFSLLGTTYGGNGTTNFALPDLRGRVPIHPGQGPGLSNHSLGEVSGTETIALIASQMPAHTHTAGASSGNGVADGPGGRVQARMPSATPQYAATSNADLAAAAVSNSGGSQPHNNLQPYLTITYVIALQGVYPSRP